jgi:glycosyltransferase involved in cell wall biosynthesis
MPKYPQISVILPVFNAESTLNRAINSVLNQTSGEFELIIIDNNSTDNSLNIARIASEKDARIRVFKESRQGVVHAFNKGLKNAFAPFIARMDADDEMISRRLRLQVDFLQNNPDVDAVAGLAEYISHHRNTKGFDEYVKWSNNLISIEDILLNRFVEMPVINPTAMWRKAVSDHLGAYREGDFPEDYEMWLRWMDKGARVGKVKEIVLRWHDSENRLTRTCETYSKEAFHHVRVKYLAKHLEKHNPFHPKVWVWGAARQTRRMAEMTENEGVVISAYIDVVVNKDIKVPLVHYSHIPKAGECFILVFVKDPVARTKIKSYLELLTYRKGFDYLFIG